MKRKLLKKLVSILLAWMMSLVFVIPDNVSIVSGAIVLRSSSIKNYVMAKVGQSYPNGYCLKFVEETYQNLGATRPYSCCASKSGNLFIKSQSRTDIPVGATVYFGNCGGGPCRSCGSSYYGHVGIYVGDGYFVHATGGKVQKSTISSWANKYRGAYMALVGSSGAGKTTLCSLIPRFYDVTGGCIRVDGKDVRKVTLKSLRDHIGMVQQDVYLFSGTIFENIRYGKPDATREEVIAAAKNANAHEFIMAFPDGYDTDIGQRGIKLSGGQKQRLSIARVFLKNPPVLIFDEATSALDNESERVVQESLEKLAKNRTTFVIAHRLTTIQNAQKILVLTEDGIAESGSHEELLARGGVYEKLYHMHY